MAIFATGKRSLAISDRSGQAFPNQEMVKVGNIIELDIKENPRSIIQRN